MSSVISYARDGAVFDVRVYEAIRMTQRSAFPKWFRKPNSKRM
jgi:hypothetical protein